MIKKAAYFLLFLSTSLHAQNDTHPETPDGEVSIENLWTPVPLFQNAIYLEETEGDGGEDPSSFTSPTYPFPFVVVQTDGEESSGDEATPRASMGEVASAENQSQITEHLQRRFPVNLRNVQRS